MVRTLLVWPVRAVGPGAFGGRRVEGRPLEPAVRTGGSRQQWSDPWWGLGGRSCGGEPSSWVGRRGWSSGGGVRGWWWRAAHVGGLGGIGRGLEGRLCCGVFREVSQELLDPGGGPGSELEECFLSVLQRAELKGRAKGRAVPWGPQASPELSAVGDVRFVEE